MSTVLVDDQLLARLLRGGRVRGVGRARQVFTTGYWYVRLCQAVLSGSGRPGALALPFVQLPDAVRDRAVRAVIELPDDIGLLSLRQLAPLMAPLRARHTVNLLAAEALAAAVHLGADVLLSVESPKLEAALFAEGRRVTVVG